MTRLLSVAVLFVCAAPLFSQTVTVSSPDANLVFTFSIADAPAEQGACSILCRTRTRLLSTIVKVERYRATAGSVIEADLKPSEGIVLEPRPGEVK